MKQKQTHELTAQSFRALIENAHEGIVIYNLKGRIRFASAGVRKIAGYKESELLGKSGKTFLHPEDATNAAKAFDKLLRKTGKSVTLLQRIRHKKGHYFWSESTLTNFVHLPEIKGVVSNFRDVTEKLKADEAAQESRELLETINRNVSEGIFMGILGTRFLYVNDAFVKMMGYRSANELLKKNFSHIFKAKHDYSKCRKQLEQALVLKDQETIFHRKNGEKFWGILNISLLKHEGKHDQFVGSIRDITREKKVEIDLLESRNFLKNVIDTVAAPLFVKDRRHRWVTMNEEFCRLIGRTQKEMTGKTDRDFLPPGEAKVFWDIDNTVLKTGKTVVNQERITSPKEGVRDLLTVKSRYVNEKGEAYIIGFISDITTVNQVKERMSALNDNLRGVMESTRESIFAVDTKLRYITFNENYKRVMKLLYGATIKPGDHMMKPAKPSPVRAWMHEEIMKAVNGVMFVSEHYVQHPKYKGYIQTTYNPIRDDKNQVKGVAVFVKDITERKRFEHIIQSINANLYAVMESTADRILAVDMKYRYIMFNQPHAASIKRLFNKDLKVGDNILKVLPPELAQIARREIGRAMKGKQFSIETKLSNLSILETTYNPIYDEQKNITGVALFIRNVTERKRIEEQMKNLNEELMQQNFQLAAQEEELKATLEELSERNFELDQLMYKTSHDLRSPLSSIMGLVNLAHLDRDPASRDNYLTKIEGRIKKLDEFIRSMLDYARVNRVEVVPEYIDLQILVQNTLRELEYLDNFNAVKIEVQVKTKAPFKSDPLRVKVIFSNIISNAYKYYNPDVQSFLSIRIEVTASLARIDFRDNGIGIKPEYLNKIFNMFYRATDRSQGSGLGMYIVKQAVEKLRGTIAIDSEYAKGTHIHVTLPNCER